MEKSVCITHTPYHILISMLLVNSSESKSDLIINPYYNPKYALMFKSILSKDIYPFDKILIVNKGGKSNTKVKMGGQAIVDSKYLDNYVRSVSNDKIYSFGDNKVIDQYVMNKSSKNTTCAYVEDGLGAYFNRRLVENKNDSDSIRYWAGEKINSINLKLRVLLHLGFIFEHLDHHGKSKYIDEINLLYPKLGHDDYSTNVIKSIDLTDRSLSLLRKFSKESIKKLNGGYDSLETIFIFPKIRLTPDSQIDKLLNVVREHNKNEKVGVKYHPSSSTKTTLPNDIFELPKYLPAEMFYITNIESIKNIIGFPSTALMTAAFLPLENILKIASFPPVVNRFQYEKKMKSIGIQTLNNEQ